MINSKFDHQLIQGWKQIHDKNIQLFRSDVQMFDQKVLKDSPFYAYFNQQLTENKRTTFVEPIQKSETGLYNLIQSFDKNAFNFSQIDPQEILFYVDVDGQQIIENTKNEDQNDVYSFIKKQVSINKSKAIYDHPLIINTSPICKFHCLWPLFINQQLPQVLSGELIQYALNLFMFSENNSFRIGFNSIGAYSTVNNFHLQTIYCDVLIPDFSMFPIERFPKQLMFKTRNDVKQCIQTKKDMEVQVGRIQGYPLRAFCLQIMPNLVYRDEMDLAYGFLAEVSQVFIELFLNKSIHHNFMISDGGLSIYIYPRQSQENNIKNSQNIRAAWVELSGFAIVRSKDFYDKLDADWFDQYLKESCSLEEEEFVDLAKEAEENLNELKQQ